MQMVNLVYRTPIMLLIMARLLLANTREAVDYTIQYSAVVNAPYVANKAELQDDDG